MHKTCTFDRLGKGVVRHPELQSLSYICASFLILRSIACIKFTEFTDKAIIKRATARLRM